MGEIVVQGETFKIKGDEPTPKETLAIDSVLASKKKNDGSLTFDEELSLMITPDEVLSDAAKGKYNKDTENFLSSPTFMRIVTEVGLSIAGGIAGAVAAPFSGGSSLALTAISAARIARLARPLLNISASKVGLIGRATLGGAVGGGVGAGVAQTFDPRESIVREVARGALQGGAGEVLGFGLAGALAKGYNKVTGHTIRQIDGAREATATLARDTEFMKVLKEIKQGKKISPERIEKLKAAEVTQGVKVRDGLTTEQIEIITNPQLASQAITKAGDLLEGTSTLLGKTGIRAEKANITPGKLTENSAIETLSGIATASILGGGMVRASEGMARRTTMQGIDSFVDAVLYKLPKAAGYDEGGVAIGQLLNDQITKSHALYNTTKNQLWDEVTEAVNKLKRPDGTFDPQYDVVWDGAGAPLQLDVLATPVGKPAYSKTVSNLNDYINEALKVNRNVDDETIKGMLGMLMRAKGRTDYNDFKNIYTAIAETRVTGRQAEVQANLLQRMQSMLNNSPLPGNIGVLRQSAAKFTTMGGSAFNNSVIKKILNTERGHEALYKQIIASGKESYYDDFARALDEGKVSYKLSDGTTKTYDLFPNKELIVGGLRGQFFKDYLKHSVEAGGQYPKLNATRAQKFLDNHDFLLSKEGFLTKSQIKNIKDYTNRIKFVEGTLKPTGAAGSNPAMFIQLNQAGAISQGIGVFAGGTGLIDPGTALFFVAAPWGLSRIFSNPKLSRIMMDGLGGGNKTIDSYSKLTRYMGQLTTALIGAGVVSAQEGEETMRQLQGNKAYYDKFFETGKYEGSIVRQSNPAEAPAIPVEGVENVGGGGGEVIDETAVLSEQLPNVVPSNLPMTGQNPQTRAALASGNLYGAIASQPQQFKTGGIISAKKNF
jgi:hypothetical protein